jgi:formamidopyrimidine-DNA glycosylase
MPELPEVESIKNYLKPLIINKKIKIVNIYWQKLVKETDVLTFFQILKEEKILDISRKGKYLFFLLKNYVLISHLRLTGNYLYLNSESKIIDNEYKGNKILFSLTFDDDSKLIYFDYRRFGTLQLQKIENYQLNKPYFFLGLEPFDSKLTVDYLKDKWKGKKKAIKSTLLEQNVICGIGNIYANEILFKVKIHPLTKTNTLTDNQLKLIIEATIFILNESIKAKGTSIRDYSVDQKPGFYQNNLKVHDRYKKLCFSCPNLIKKIKISGRTSFFCFFCQK